MERARRDGHLLVVLCSSSSAHRRFLGWTEAGVFREFWRRGLLAYDDLAGIDWGWLAIDGAMTKAPLGGGNRAQPDRSGRARHAKRSLLTDSRGVPLGLAVAGANRNDFKLARETLAAIPVARPEPSAAAPQGLCLDKDYDRAEVRDLAAEFGFTAHIRGRGEEAQGLKCHTGARARRWAVERTHSWMNRFRRILVRWEKRPDTYLALLHFSPSASSPGAPSPYRDRLLARIPQMDWRSANAVHRFQL